MCLSASRFRALHPYLGKKPRHLPALIFLLGALFVDDDNFIDGSKSSLCGYGRSVGSFSSLNEPWLVPILP